MRPRPGPGSTAGRRRGADLLTRSGTTHVPGPRARERSGGGMLDCTAGGSTPLGERRNAFDTSAPPTAPQKPTPDGIAATAQVLKGRATRQRAGPRGRRRKAIQRPLRWASGLEEGRKSAQGRLAREWGWARGRSRGLVAPGPAPAPPEINRRAALAGCLRPRLADSAPRAASIAAGPCRDRSWAARATGTPHPSWVALGTGLRPRHSGKQREGDIQGKPAGVLTQNPQGDFPGCSNIDTARNPRPLRRGTGEKKTRQPSTRRSP